MLLQLLYHYTGRATCQVANAHVHSKRNTVGWSRLLVLELALMCFPAHAPTTGLWSTLLCDLDDWEMTSPNQNEVIFYRLSIHAS